MGDPGPLIAQHIVHHQFRAVVIPVQLLMDAAEGLGQKGLSLLCQGMGLVLEVRKHGLPVEGGTEIVQMLGQQEGLHLPGPAVLQEVVVEQPQNDTVTLLHEGAVEAVFPSYGQFLAYYMKTKMADNVETTTPDGERHVLWLQDRESPGVWKPETGKTDIWDCILFRQREALEQYRAAGGKGGRMFYGVPRDYRRNRARGEALVLTASDQLEGVEYLAEELPEVRFHIAANTQVSEKLWSLTARENIMVYPQIGARELEDLWERCDFYLDINHYREVFDAIPQAHGRNLAILGFEDTLHGRELTAEEGIFTARDYEGMAQALGDFVGYPEAVGAFLRRQQEKKRQNWEGLLERLAPGKDGGT